MGFKVQLGEGLVVTTKGDLNSLMSDVRDELLKRGTSLEELDRPVVNGQDFVQSGNLRGGKMDGARIRISSWTKEEDE